jgi:transposase
MRDHELYAAILGVQHPWQVTSVALDLKGEEVRVVIAAVEGTRFPCPQCQSPCPGYDTRRRSFRHLDTCQFKTVLEADVPRIECTEHGVLQIEVPWAEPNSGFTALMEALIIDWLKEASISAVARRMRLTWDQIDTVMQRAVRRGLQRRVPESVAQLGVDETSFQKRHEYVTNVYDLQTGRVLHVADGRSKAALDSFYAGLSPEQRLAIEVIAMDMCPAYISSTRQHVPGATDKIAFDRFHVAQRLNAAVNAVRKLEHRELTARGVSTLARTRFLWLQNLANMSRESRELFNLLRRCQLKVGRAWAIKETARELWHYVSRTWASKAWKRWIRWASRCGLEPMQRAAATVKEHLWGIINAIVLGATNAMSESRNAKIQWIKKNACGFRNRERFRNAIYFHCGGLDLYPAKRLTHTNA